jgi:hypothetical protein
MMLAWLVIAGEAVTAFLTLDLFFRYMSVDPALLRERLLWHALIYAAIAALCVGGGGIAQWWSAGYGGLVPAALNWIPWWLLWRFGLRKQFTYLFKSDGGRSLK